MSYMKKQDSQHSTNHPGFSTGWQQPLTYSVLALLLLSSLFLMSGCTPKQDPTQAAMLFQQSEEARAQGKTDEALASLKKAHQLDLINSQYTLNLAKMLIYTGKFEDAEKILTKAIKNDAENLDLRLVNGENYITWAQKVTSIVDQGALADKAVLEFKYILQKNPDHFDALMFLANSYAHYPNMNDFHTQAEQCFKHLLQIEKPGVDLRFAQVYYYYGEFLEMKERKQEAQAIWERGAKLYPEDKLLKEKL